MKKIILAAILLITVISCTKEQNVAACGFVFDKYYQNPPADTTLANRTYWLHMAQDTLGTFPGNTYVIQVQKTIWDTMLVNSSWEIYCY